MKRAHRFSNWLISLFVDEKMTTDRLAALLLTLDTRNKELPNLGGAAFEDLQILSKIINPVKYPQDTHEIAKSKKNSKK